MAKAKKLSGAEAQRLQHVTLPPMPKKVFHTPRVQYYKHACKNCAKEFESSVKSMQIIICANCWAGKSATTGSVVKYQFKGLRCKKNLPK